MSLKEYRRKRKFDQTPEPAPRAQAKAGKGLLRFVVQKHDATREHYDFRLEIDGAFRSWAVPKGPTLTSGDPRLAVKVEDHPIEYGGFEGVIPKGNYGAGTVMIWDAETFVERGSKSRIDSTKALLAGMAKGHLTFILSGEKLRGEFALLKIKKSGAADNAWLLVKKHDAEASRIDILKQDRSTVSGRSMEEIAEQSVAAGDVWIPGKGRRSKHVAKKKVVAPRVAVASKTIPHRIRPMEPVFAAGVPSETGWCFENFGTGIRALAEIDRGNVKLFSRSLLPLEKKYPKIVKRLGEFKHTALLDGEIIGGDFVASDLLFLDGKDFRLQALSKRKVALVKLSIPIVDSTVRFADLKTSGTMIVAKKLDSLYRSGLTRDWLRFRIRTGKGVIAKEAPPFTHLEKVFWPKEGYTKGDLVKYYEQVAEAMLPYLIDRPQSLHRQPDGLRNEGFFHKDMTSFLPRRMKTERVFSGSSGRTINYVLCQDRWALLFLVNLGCIEFNPWLSRRQNLEKPELVVIDLDPDDDNEFSRGEYAKRVLKGKGRSFKLLGDQSMVTYVVMDASAGLTDEEVEAFKDRWGDKATEDLITRDFASIRFDGKVLEANYDAIVDALSVLPADIVKNLFKPMLLKAKSGAVERAKKYAKSADDLEELIQQLKIRNYIR